MWNRVAVMELRCADVKCGWDCTSRPGTAQNSSTRVSFGRNAKVLLDQRLSALIHPPSLPGLTRQSIGLNEALFFRWMPGSSPGMTGPRSNHHGIWPARWPGEQKRSRTILFTPSLDSGNPLCYRTEPFRRAAFFGRIAQLVEQLTLNQRVPGSSPGAPTNKINHFGAIDASDQTS